MSFENILSSQKPFLKSSEVAKIFNVDHSTVFLWVKKKKLHPIRTPGGNFRFAKAEVERLFREVQGSGSERRKSPRFQVLFPVQVRFSKEGEQCTCQAFIQDISEHGLGLLVRENGKPLDDLIHGQVREISVHNDGISSIKEVLRGEVRHAHPAGDRKVMVGVLIGQ